MFDAYIVVLWRRGVEVLDKLAKRQLHSIGASQALLNRSDENVDDQAFLSWIRDRAGMTMFALLMIRLVS